MNIEEKEIVITLATLTQQGLDLARRLESYHCDIKLYKNEAKEDIRDQNRILLADVKEHINMVGALQKADIKESREYCEEENRTLNNSIVKLSNRLDKFVYGSGGALIVISVIAWIIERFT